MTRRWRNVGWLAALVAAVCVGLSAGRAAADDVKPAAPATTEGATDTAPEPAATPAKPARAPSAEKPAAPPTATKPGMSEPAPAATAATGKPDAAPAERAIRADVALIPGRVSALLSIRGGPAHLQLNTSGVLLFWTTPAEAQWLSRVPTRDARSLSLVFPDVPHDPMAPMTSETTVTVPARPPLFRDVPHDPAAPAREPQPAASGEQDTLRDVPRDTDVFGLETATRQYQALNAWSRAARLPLALRTDGADLGLGEERAFELNLSDGGPRAYLEPQDGGLYRRIELVDRDGYQIILHVGREGNDVTVEMTRKAVVGGRLDEGTGAMVGKPSVVKTVCTLTAPLTTGQATVVLWGMSDEALRVQPDQPSLAVVLMDAATARNVPARPAAAAGGGFGTQGGPVLHGNATSRLPASAEVRQPKATVPAPANQPGGEARQPVRLDFAVYDVPADTPEWKALGEAKDLPAALKELADKGAVRVVAKPSLVTFSGTTGNIHVAERVALTDERVAAAGGAMGAADNDFAGAGQGPAQTLRATPTVQPDGRILLVAEVELEQWVQVRDARDSGFGVLAKRTVTARLLLEPGHVAVLRGLGRISSTTYDGEARQPVETFVTVEASLAASTAAPAP